MNIQLFFQRMHFQSPISERMMGFFRRFGGWIVIGWTVFSIVIINFVLPLIKAPSLTTYVVHPLLWITLGIFVLVLQKRETGKYWMGVEKSKIWIAIVFSVLQLAVMMIGGLISGFGYSPYATTWYLKLLNVWFLVSRVFGMELARWYIIAKMNWKDASIGVFISWLLFMVASISLYQLIRLGAPADLFSFISYVLLPELAKGLLASYLVMVGGPLPSFIYIVILNLFEWLMPVLPDLPMLVNAFIAVMVPALGLVIIHRYFIAEPTPEEVAQQQAVAEASPAAAAVPATKAKKPSVTFWVITALVAVSIFWFNSGMFGVRPTVVSGFSMDPTFVAGDIVITRDVPASSIQVGDVIRFKNEGIYILHRVMAISAQDGLLVFTTRGDANNVDDAPVYQQQLAGKVILILPKVGWPVVLVQKFISWVGSIFL